MTNLTAIYNTSCFFAYLFSVMLLRERIVLKKVLAVFLSLAGVAVIAITSQSTDESAKQAFPMVGNVLALILAALYGFEEVIYKKYASPTIMPITFANTLTGLMGIVTLFVLWIFIPIFHWIGHEVFEWPTGREFGGVLLVATCGLVYNGCFMIVVSQTSPVFAAVGVMATIPIMTLVDWGIFRESVSWGSIVGGVCILVGFAILVRENHKQALRAS
ncbi:hypothetical protein FBU30_002597 [Linnemannia zychae]|nr:hypothetical protein FBU30_002597 [Linnemannia zychae]